MGDSGTKLHLIKGSVYLLLVRLLGLILFYFIVLINAFFLFFLDKCDLRDVHVLQAGSEFFKVAVFTFTIYKLCLKAFRNVCVLFDRNDSLLQCTAWTLGAAPPCVPRACEIYNDDDDGDDVACTRLCWIFPMKAIPELLFTLALHVTCHCAMLCRTAPQMCWHACSLVWQYRRVPVILHNAAVICSKWWWTGKSKISWCLLHPVNVMYCDLTNVVCLTA